MAQRDLLGKSVRIADTGERKNLPLNPNPLGNTIAQNVGQNWKKAIGGQRFFFPTGMVRLLIMSMTCVVPIGAGGN